MNVFRVLAPIYAASTVLLLASGPAALAARGDRIQGATYARKHWHTLRLLLPPAYEAVGPEDASARADYVMRTTAMFILVLGALGIVITALLALQARGVRSMDPYVPFPVWMRMLRAARRKGRPWQFGRSSRAAIAGRPGRRHHTLSEDSGYFSDQTDDSSVVDSESVWSGDRTTTPGDGIVSGLRDESRPFASPDRGAGPRAPRHYGTLAGAAGRGKPTLEFGEAHEKLFPASEASTPLTTDTPREYITYRVRPTPPLCQQRRRPSLARVAGAQPQAQRAGGECGVRLPGPRLVHHPRSRTLLPPRLPRGLWHQRRRGRRPLCLR